MPGMRLSLEQREIIARGIGQGLSQKVIAAVVGCHPSTVCRELARERVDTPGPRGRSRKGFGGRPREYRPGRAHDAATERGRRPKECRLVGPLAGVVTGWLEADWSPQQISAMLPVVFPDDEAMRVSHETIYQSLYVQSRGELRRELAAHLRTGRPARRPRRDADAPRRGRLIGMVPLSDRPAQAGDRAVPGHWEGDLLLGGVGKGACITLVERTTRFVLLAPLPGTHTAIDLRATLTELIARLPDQLKRSLTWDQGKEMAHHAAFTVDTGLQVYFCDPHSPWQRGSNENSGGLLRQYLPKGCDMRDLTQDDCDAIALRLNTRPRKTLQWQTPSQALDRVLIASTG